MKKIRCIFAAVLLLLTLTVQGLAEEDRTITVTGNATVSLAADYAELQIGVNTRKDTMQEAQQENAQAMAAVLEAIYQAGISEKDVITSQFNVFCGTDYSMQPDGQEIQKNYYTVENMLRVTIRDLESAGQVLDAAIQAGANQTYGITFSSSKENEAYQKALVRAVEDAKGKAQVLAGAADKTLGDILMMDASQNYFDYGIRNVYYAKETATDSSIVSGDVSVSASVKITWNFK